MLPVAKLLAVDYNHDESGFFSHFQTNYNDLCLI